MAKLYTKAYFARRGRQATFMAQLGPQFPGLGGHPSLSLRSTVDGEPALFEEPGVLSKVGAAAVAGVDRVAARTARPGCSLPQLLPALRPWQLGAVHGHLGPRQLQLRAACAWPTTPDRRASSCASPVPTSARTTVPRLFLGSALWGIEERLEPPPPVRAPDDGRSDSTAVPLPRDLVEAAERFWASAAARDLFGPAFVEHYAAARRVEAAACHRFVSDEERSRYLAQV